MKKLILIIMIAVLTLTLAACGNKSINAMNNNTKTNNMLQIEVSFNAIKDFAEAVGGDKVEVKVIIPNGTEPHDFEPKAGDIIGLGDAKIFVYNGLGMETWVDNVLNSIDNKNLISVDASAGSKAIAVNTNNGKGQYDPHLWLSLKGAEVETGNILNALVKADPSNKSYYEKNYKAYYNKLENLYNEYNIKLGKLKNKDFVTGHAAFAYLCRDFGLKQNSVEDVFADGEPSANKLKELIDYCKANNIKTVFVEDMVSPRVTETLANEVGAKVQRIYTVESKEDKKDYLQCMKENLENIYNSLK